MGGARSVHKVRLVIKCDESLRRRFRAFVARMGFSSGEEALRFLLDHYEKTRVVEAEVFGSS